VAFVFSDTPKQGVLTLLLIVLSLQLCTVGKLALLPRGVGESVSYLSKEIIQASLVNSI